MSADMVRAWVETLIERYTDTSKAIPDGDGDYPVEIRSAIYYVRVGDVDPVVVQLFVIAVDQVDLNGDLATHLNEVNSRLRFCRVFWVQKQVLFETDLLGETLSEAAFRESAKDLAAATETFAPDIAEEFGGRLRFHDSQSSTYVPPADEGVGFYL